MPYAVAMEDVTGPEIIPPAYGDADMQRTVEVSSIKGFGLATQTARKS